MTISSIFYDYLILTLFMYYVCGGLHVTVQMQTQVHALIPASGFPGLNLVRLDTMWLHPLSHLISAFMMTLK